MARLKITAFVVLSIALAGACAFFTYYTLRLIYVNLTVPDVARHRQSGMYIGAVAFPVASLVFGYVSFRVGRSAFRSIRTRGD